MVGRVLKIYTQGKAQLLPPKITQVKVKLPFEKSTQVKEKKYLSKNLLEVQVTFHFNSYQRV